MQHLRDCVLKLPVTLSVLNFVFCQEIYVETGWKGDFFYVGYFLCPQIQYTSELCFLTGSSELKGHTLNIIAILCN